VQPSLDVGGEVLEEALVLPVDDGFEDGGKVASGDGIGDGVDLPAAPAQVGLALP
jgi:hypothetical protein